MVCGYIVVHTSVEVAVWVYTHYGSSGKRCGTFPLWRLKRNTKNSVMSSKEKRRKKFSFFLFFLRNQQKIPLRHELFYHTDREKRTYHGGGGGRDFLHTTDDDERDGQVGREKRAIHSALLKQKCQRAKSEERKEKYKKSCPIGYAYLHSYTVTSSTSFPSFLLFL